jgi:hypothetical protein
MLDAKQYLNSEGNSPMELSCDMDKLGELKGLVGGSTTIVGHTGLNRTCFGSLARTAEQPSNGLGADKMQVSALFPPSTASADGVCASFQDGDTTAFLIMAGGAVLDGDPSIAALGAPTPGCETIDVCCRSKFVCVASTSNTPTDKFGQTYAEIRSSLAQGLAEYDALQLSPWTWSPMTDLVRCP